MLQLAVFQPNALRQSVFNELPPGATEFNWFFFGKRFFDPGADRFVLDVARHTQFYDRKTGETYEVADPDGARFLLLRRGGAGSDDLKICRQRGYAGCAMRAAASTGSPRRPMRPPINADTMFVALPGRLAAVDDWTRINLFRYVCRELGFASREAQPQLVAARGVPGASKILYAETALKP